MPQSQQLQNGGSSTPSGSNLLKGLVQAAFGAVVGALTTYLLALVGGSIHRNLPKPGPSPAPPNHLEALHIKIETQEGGLPPQSTFHFSVFDRRGVEYLYQPVESKFSGSSVRRLESDLSFDTAPRVEKCNDLTLRLEIGSTSGIDDWNWSMRLGGTVTSTTEEEITIITEASRSFSGLQQTKSTKFNFLCQGF